MSMAGPDCFSALQPGGFRHFSGEIGFLLLKSFTKNESGEAADGHITPGSF